MANDYQHCADCEQEYVAGVATCVDCGKALMPGPLPRYAGSTALAADAASGTDAAMPSGAGDRLLAELPGAQAHEVVQALLMEKLACRVECRGIHKAYQPDQPAPDMPFAGSLPVRIYVAVEHLDAASEIVQSISQGDLIGEQWSEAPHPDAVEIDAEYEALPVAGVPAEPAAAELEAAATHQPGDFSVGVPEAQSTSLRTIIIVVVVVIALLYFFGRQ